MEVQALIEKFEQELRETRQDYKEGKLIRQEDFDWGMPLGLMASERVGEVEAPK